METIALGAAFWSSSGAEYRRIYKTNELEKEMGLTEALFRMPSARVSWVAAFYLLCYVGVEVALGGWIVVFMLRVRHGEPFASGMSAVGFWLGITVGRAVLGFVTPRIGVKLSTAVSFLR
jgi:fucose permease